MRRWFWGAYRPRSQFDGGCGASRSWAARTRTSPRCWAGRGARCRVVCRNRTTVASISWCTRCGALWSSLELFGAFWRRRQALQDRSDERQMTNAKCQMPNAAAALSPQSGLLTSLHRQSDRVRRLQEAQNISAGIPIQSLTMTKNIDVNGKVFSCPESWTVDEAEKKIRSQYCLGGGAIVENGGSLLGSQVIGLLTGALYFVDGSSTGTDRNRSPIRFLIPVTRPNKTLSLCLSQPQFPHGPSQPHPQVRRHWLSRV